MPEWNKNYSDIQLHIPGDDFKKNLKTLLKENVSLPRYIHSQRVWQFCRRLVRRKNLAGQQPLPKQEAAFASEQSAKDDLYWLPRLRLASLIHDLTKEKSKQFQLNLMDTANDYPLDWDFSKTKKLSATVWHGHTACLFLWQELKFFDRDVCRLVMNHTQISQWTEPNVLLFFSADFLASIYLYQQPDYRNFWRNSLEEKTIEQIAAMKMAGNISAMTNRLAAIPSDMIADYHKLLSCISKK